eukprot:gene6869-biopygen1421
MAGYPCWPCWRKESANSQHVVPPGLSHKARDLSHKARDLAQKARDLAQKARGLAHKARDLAHKARGLAHKARYLTHKAMDPDWGWCPVAGAPDTFSAMLSVESRNCGLPWVSDVPTPVYRGITGNTSAGSAKGTWSLVQRKPHSTFLAGRAVNCLGFETTQRMSGSVTESWYRYGHHPSVRGQCAARCPDQTACWTLLPCRFCAATSSLGCTSDVRTCTSGGRFFAFLVFPFPSFSRLTADAWPTPWSTQKNSDFMTHTKAPQQHAGSRHGVPDRRYGVPDRRYGVPDRRYGVPDRRCGGGGAGKPCASCAGRNGGGRGPDADRTIQFKEVGADRTRAAPFLPQGSPG